MNNSYLLNTGGWADESDSDSDIGDIDEVYEDDTTHNVIDDTLNVATILDNETSVKGDRIRRDRISPRGNGRTSTVSTRGNSRVNTVNDRSRSRVLTNNQSKGRSRDIKKNVSTNTRSKKTSGWKYPDVDSTTVKRQWPVRSA